MLQSPQQPSLHHCFLSHELGKVKKCDQRFRMPTNTKHLTVSNYHRSELERINNFAPSLTMWRMQAMPTSQLMFLGTKSEIIQGISKSFETCIKTEQKLCFRRMQYESSSTHIVDLGYLHCWRHIELRYIGDIYYWIRSLYWPEVFLIWLTTFCEQILLQWIGEFINKNETDWNLDLSNTNNIVVKIKLYPWQR